PRTFAVGPVARGEDRPGIRTLFVTVRTDQSGVPRAPAFRRNSLQEKLMRKISKRSAVVLGAAGVVLVAGVAYAAWTSTGAGSGSVTAKTAVDSVIQPNSGTGLYPGSDTTFTVTIDNKNDYVVKV